MKISPLNYGITPEIDKENHTVKFTITEPDTYTVTFNDSPERALHIFANPIETDVPSPDDENVVYIGPGNGISKPLCWKTVKPCIFPAEL